MYQTIKSNYKALVVSLLLIPTGQLFASETKPYFNEKNQSDAFFDKTLVLTSASDFQNVLTKKWDYPAELKHETLGKKSVASCQQLQASIAQGYNAAQLYEYALVNALSSICSMWELQGHFKPYSQYYMGAFKLDKSFASHAPAQFGLVISNDDERKMQTASNWADFSKIKKVDMISDTQSTYYDYSGSIQRLNLMAKGDYNNDGIEDWLLLVENNVEGGSYSSTKVYVVTRISADANITLLKML